MINSKHHYQSPELPLFPFGNLGRNDTVFTTSQILRRSLISVLLWTWSSRTPPTPAALPPLRNRRPPHPHPQAVPVHGLEMDEQVSRSPSRRSLSHRPAILPITSPKLRTAPSSKWTLRTTTRPPTFSRPRPLRHLDQSEHPPQFRGLPHLPRPFQATWGLATSRTLILFKPLKTTRLPSSSFSTILTLSSLSSTMPFLRRILLGWNNLLFPHHVSFLKSFFPLTNRNFLSVFARMASPPPHSRTPRPSPLPRSTAMGSCPKPWPP